MDIKQLNKELTKLIEAWGGNTQSENNTARELYNKFWSKIFHQNYDFVDNLTNILFLMYMLRFGGRLKNAQLEKKLKGLDNSKTTFSNVFYDTDYFIWDDGDCSSFVKDITKYDEDNFPINDDYKYQVTDFKGLYNFIKENYDELYKLVYNTKNLGLENIDSISAKNAVNILTKELKERVLEPTKYNLDIMKQYLAAF